MQHEVQIAACGGGIIASLVVYSILQERIMTKPFGHNGEHFKCSLLLVLCNRLVSCSFAALTLVVQRQCLLPAAPILSYSAVSVSNVVATSCQYEALKHVSFPIQTLGKCAKMIPVMLWGTLIAGKQYAAKDYVLAASVALGCSAFMLSGRSASKQQQGSNLLGGALLLTYLAFDGFTSTFQGKLFKQHQMSAMNQMLYVNICSALLSLLGLISSRQLLPALGFVCHHPEALQAMLLLSVAASAGQVLIIYTIRQFGALAFATIMTTRQFISVLVSCAVFAHPLSTGQWSGTVVVFGTLYFSAFLKSSNRSSRPQSR